MTRTSLEWLQTFEEQGIPAGPIYDLDDLFRDPQVQYRQMVTQIDYLEGSVPAIRLPWVFDDAKLLPKGPPPKLGEHTEQILNEELGYSLEQLDWLKTSGVV